MKLLTFQANFLELKLLGSCLILPRNYQEIGEKIETSFIFLYYETKFYCLIHFIVACKEIVYYSIRKPENRVCVLTGAMFSLSSAPASNSLQATPSDFWKNNKTPFYKHNVLAQPQIGKLFHQREFLSNSIAI